MDFVTGMVTVLATLGIPGAIGGLWAYFRKQHQNELAAKDAAHAATLELVTTNHKEVVDGLRQQLTERQAEIDKRDRKLETQDTTMQTYAESLEKVAGLLGRQTDLWDVVESLKDLVDPPPK